MLSERLAQADTIAIGGHVRPDGDCVGSSMGLYQYIQENYENKTVDVYLEEIPDKLRFIGPTERIRHEIPEGKAYDLFICLDCADKKRLAFSAPLFDAAKHTLCIDHHVSNDSFAEENHIEPEASSTSEIVYRLLEKERVSRAAAEAFYVGIIHDTGAFQYSCASPTTFRVAAELLEKGVNAPRLIQKTFTERTYAQNQVFGKAFMDGKLLLDGRCIAAYIRKDEMEHYGVKRCDLDGIASQLRDTKGVEVAIYMDEFQPDTYKISLRSDELVDVSVIAKSLGGGGHKKAAGLSMEGDPEEIIAKLAEQIRLQLENSGS